VRTVRIWRLIGVGVCVLLSGCVIGSGPCLWLQANHTFSGHLHFRDFPTKDGIDNVPILILDKTEYVYSPARSFQCSALNDVQLVGLAEFPQSVGENSHISVRGSVREGVSGHEYTPFLIHVTSILPPRPPR
jgi:hypothetical protein